MAAVAVADVAAAVVASATRDDVAVVAAAVAGSAPCVACAAAWPQLRRLGRHAEGAAAPRWACAGALTWATSCSRAPP